MEKVMCAKGHFYDGDRYQECPHCAAGMEAAAPSAFQAAPEAPREEDGKEKSEEKRGLFSRRKERQGKEAKNKGKRGEKAADTEPGHTEGSDRKRNTEQGDDVPGSGYGSARGRASMETVPDENVTRPLSGEGGQTAMPYGENVTQEIGSAAIPTGEKERGYPSSVTPHPQSVEPEIVCMLPAASAPPAKDRIPEEGMGGIAENPGRNTAGISPKSARRDEGKTIGYYSAGADSDPPVGYLICIEGEDYGIGFPLKSGSNSLGRSSSMDVVIMDLEVSREKQAYVMYEPHKREFFLKPGDSSGLCYLNGEFVMEPKKLQAYDLIQLGKTKLMLIPVCGEKFSWQEKTD